MTLEEKIKEAFATRCMPTQLVDSHVTQFDSDVEESLWFAGRDSHELTGRDWQERADAIYFFSPEAFAYYLPSLLRVSARNPNQWISAADALISSLDMSPSVEGWPDHFVRRFRELRSEELGILREWLLCVCEYPAYQGYGLSASGPGDRFARAFDTVDLLQKELARK